jgi:hypothetical protein
MAKKRDLPGFAEKRKILFGAKTTPEKLRETGEQFLEAERYDDALEFFQRCDAADLARQVADRAMSAGNVPLYMRAKRVLGEPVEDGEWKGLAAAAEGQGRLSMAYVAQLKAGNGSEAERLKQKLPSQSEQAEAEALPDASEGVEAEDPPDEPSEDGGPQGD